MGLLPDEGRFLRDVTPRICGHLEIEEALRSCAAYLANIMPAQKMYLDWYDHELGSLRTVAAATPREARALDRIVPMSPALRRQLTSFRGKSPEDAVYIINRASDDAIVVKMFEALGEPLDASLLVTYPALNQRMLGAVVLIASGADRFTEEHAALFALVREPFAIALRNAMEHREVLRLKELLADDNRYLQRQLLDLSGKEIVGADFGLAGVMRAARHVATHDSPVLLLGETGVGKDVIANYIHYSSSRSAGPFIKVNCGAIPDSLIDSELFGHEKGAFTGALERRRGRFERAHRGTILLDEVAELPPLAQVRLLRVLQSREIERVGGTETIRLDIRVIAATNRNLQQLVEQGRFREDLWYRLNVVPIVIPPLRERKNDIPALVQHLLARKAGQLKLREPPQMTPGMMDRLLTYDWPGNIRELENVIERALILGDDVLSFDHLVPEDSEHTASRIPPARPRALKLDDVVTAHVRHVLKLTKGRIHGDGGAAEILGMNPSTLRHRMRKLGIPYGRRGSASR